MVIPVHLDPISIPVLIGGIYVLIQNKKLSIQVAQTYSTRYKTFMGGHFLKRHEWFVRHGFYRFAVIFGGTIITIMTWAFSFGPIYTGSAEQEYNQEQQAQKGLNQLSGN